MDSDKITEEYRRQVHVTVLKLVHFIVSCGIFYLFWLLFRYDTILPEKSIGFRYNYYVLFGYAGILFFFNRTYNSYLLGYSTIKNLISSEFLAQLFSLSILYFAISIAWFHFNNPLMLFFALIIQIIFNASWAIFATQVYFRLYPTKRTILVYRNEIDKKRFGSIKGKPSSRLYKVVKELRYEGRSYSELRSELIGYDAIFVAGVDSRCRNGIAKFCKEECIPGFFLPHVGDVIMQEAMHIQSFDSPVLYVTRTQTKPELRLIKRLFDIVSSCIVLVVLGPVMLVTALAIHFYDGGPALYKQTRLTRNGKEFQILKFRSMRIDAEDDGVARLSSGADDDRITSIGRFLRKYRLDELPQLINILKGDMSVVGPRPERPEIAEKYCETIPDFKLRLQVKAGLTGYAQVYGKYNTDPYEKLEFDLLYIKNIGVLTDLQLIFATIAILFMPESTEGITAGQITAMDYENEECGTEDSIKSAESYTV